MRACGIDCTSRPTGRKPITCPECRVEGEQLQAGKLTAWRDLDGFDAALRSPGPRIAGICVPFDLARRFVETIGWPDIPQRRQFFVSSHPMSLGGLGILATRNSKLATVRYTWQDDVGYPRKLSRQELRATFDLKAESPVPGFRPGQRRGRNSSREGEPERSRSRFRRSPPAPWWTPPKHTVVVPLNVHGACGRGLETRAVEELPERRQGADRVVRREGAGNHPPADRSPRRRPMRQRGHLSHHNPSGVW